MLSTKKEKKKALEPGTTQNRINEGTAIIGDITSSGYFRIDGRIEGNLKTPSKVVLGKTGHIIGSLTCESADIEGKIEGNIEVSGLLSLRATAIIDGDVTVGKLAVEVGAVVNASCVMLENKTKSQQTDNATKQSKPQNRELASTEAD